MADDPQDKDGDEGQDEIIWVEDGEVNVAEEALLGMDAEKALQDLAEQLEGEMEVVGFAGDMSAIDLPEVNVGGPRNPIIKEPVAIDLPEVKGPKVMIMTMMMKLY